MVADPHTGTKGSSFLVKGCTWLPPPTCPPPPTEQQNAEQLQASQNGQAAVDLVLAAQAVATG